LLKSKKKVFASQKYFQSKKEKILHTELADIPV